jgi:hypothetical protein
LTFRFSGIFILSSALLHISAGGAKAQTPDGPQAPPPPPPTVQTTPPVTAPSAPPAPNVPDYPDPRSLTIGLLFWDTSPSSQPNIVTGRAATDFETLNGIGKVHRAPGFEASYPITRTGSLHVEAFEIKGTGSQTATKALDIYTTPISIGDFLDTQFQVRNVKIYLDDLLYPHKFPVSRLRFKAIYGLEYVGVHANANAPFVTAGEIADGTQNIILPVFGLAAEYALAKHVLFRLDGSGFGIPRRSDIWDAAATLSWRVGHIEVKAGGKALHYKSGPNSTEYQIGTFDGAFAGVSWHF